MTEHEDAHREPDATLGEDASAQHDDEGAKKGLSLGAKIILTVLGLAVLVVGVIWYLRYESTGKYLQDTNDAQVMADMVTVSPRVAGYVAEVLVRDHQDVTAGQPLARIDSRSSEAQAAQAKAQIAVAAAQADNARAQIREQYATIDQARAQLAAARSKAAYDAGEVARYRPLAASGAESRQQLVQLEATARQSAEDARAQAAALTMQQRRVASIQSQVRQGTAQGQAARAQLDAADVDVGATLIRAATAGRIGDKTVTVGQYVQAGTRLMSIVPLDRMYITANFKETQLALMRPGQPVSIEVDAIDGIALKGRVESVSPGTGAQFSLLPPQNATGNFTKITQRVPVRISIEASPSAKRLLVPGLSVVVTVDTIGAKGELDRIRDQQKQLDRKDR
ncbi:membrane fusion protein (multidrug efflux system) [Sphingomonas sp. PP-CE-3A-406]|uniref:HlyD family secretion protein n=1 Tax=unclassified Sphingomonas TaxID=196159 RepID=UPI000713B1FC|nr:MULTISPECIES: HlyD family secretion protein [unclassified Sphingomonas]KQO12093.1 multidrug ABC transporter permease [Sphingomonas sp. Leaf242]RMB54648.1 membrane fusion protein (multidrug efflux system) [Sphingomonas sp. PP-CE-3A-406]